MKSKERGNVGFVISDTSLGAELRRARGDRSLNTISLACGVSIATLSRIEAGKIETPSRETLASISHAYGVPLEVLAQLVYCGHPADVLEPVTV